MQSIADFFPADFASAGYVFSLVPWIENCCPASLVSILSVVEKVLASCGFAFEHIYSASVLKASKAIDPRPRRPRSLFTRTAEFLAEPLASILNLSLSTNSIPKSWKEVYILPIFKGGDPSDLDIYRPISKLSVVAKIMESLVNDLLKEFLLEKGQLSPAQSGFTSGHRTSASKVMNNIIISNIIFTILKIIVIIILTKIVQP